MSTARTGGPHSCMCPFARWVYFSPMFIPADRKGGTYSSLLWFLSTGTQSHPSDALSRSIVLGGEVLSMPDSGWGRRSRHSRRLTEVEKDACVVVVGLRKKSRHAARFAASAYASRSYPATTPLIVTAALSPEIEEDAVLSLLDQGRSRTALVNLSLRPQHRGCTRTPLAAHPRSRKTHKMSSLDQGRSHAALLNWSLRPQHRGRT